MCSGRAWRSDCTGRERGAHAAPPSGGDSRAWAVRALVAEMQDAIVDEIGAAVVDESRLAVGCDSRTEETTPQNANGRVRRGTE